MIGTLHDSTDKTERVKTIQVGEGKNLGKGGQEIRKHGRLRGQKDGSCKVDARLENTFSGICNNKLLTSWKMETPTK